tara:strand:- start:1012 stop:2067 length:1056 start_codon:yes stop_codon:yes gene_type:complete
MNKQIAIITYQNVKNYGAFLQVYALQKILERETSFKVKIINYKSQKFILKELRQCISKNLKKTVLNLLSLCSYFVYRNKLNLDKFTINKKKAITQKYEFIVYGSDEIWNFNNEAIGFDDFYFGKYHNLKKYAFSASFGTVNKNQKELKKILSYLKKFEKISVRDINSSKILNHLNIDHQITLDPVLLYDFSEELKNITNIYKKNRYILIYGEVYDKKIIKNIKLLKIEKNLEIISLGYYNYWADKNIIYSLNPFLFLKIFKEAESIVTSMFHGTVLSIKFNKKFFLLENEYRVNKLSDLKKKFNFQSININKNKDLYIDFRKKINKQYSIKKKKILINNINESIDFIARNF